MRLPMLVNSRRFWNCLILSVFLVLTFPGDFSPMRPGLDFSWIYAVNILPHTGYSFGRDIVHPFGPLGFLLSPLNVGMNLIVATGFRLFIHAIFAACILYFAVRTSSMLRITLFVCGYMISMAAVIELDYSYHLIIVESLLVLLADRNRQLWWLVTPAAGALAASLLFMKFGIGLLALSIYATVAICRLRAWQDGAPKIALTVVASYLIPFAILVALFLHSTHNMVAWITRSMDLSNGFQSAQSLGGSSIFLLLALASGMVYACIALCFFRWRSDLRIALTAFVPALFIAFKHGFVREDGHERNFFPFVLALISVFVLFATSKRELRALIFGFCLVLAFSVPIGIYYGKTDPHSRPIDTLSGKKGMSNLIDTVGFRRTQRRLDLESAANFRNSRLPEEWVDDIRGHHWTVDVIPWELTYVFANHLNWDPEPTLHSFMAYTPALDQWSAQHFDSETGPDVLIAEFAAVDGRNLLLESPAMTRSILDNYDLQREDVLDNLFLLKRRPKPLREKSVTLAEQEIHNGEWAEVPNSANAVLAHLDLSLSVTGRVIKALYRISRVNVDLIYKSGQQLSYRFTPGVAKDGLLLNYLPRSPTEFSDLLHHRPFDKVLKLRLSGAGLKYYRPSVHLRWEEAAELHLSGQPTLTPATDMQARSCMPEMELLSRVQMGWYAEPFVRSTNPSLSVFDSHALRCTSLGFPRNISPDPKLALMF